MEYVTLEDHLVILREAAMHLRQAANEMDNAALLGCDGLEDESGWLKETLKSVEDKCDELRKRMDRIEAEWTEEEWRMFGGVEPDRYEMAQGR